MSAGHGKAEPQKAQGDTGSCRQAQGGEAETGPGNLLFLLTRWWRLPRLVVHHTPSRRKLSPPRLAPASSPSLLFAKAPRNTRGALRCVQGSCPLRPAPPVHPCGLHLLARAVCPCSLHSRACSPCAAERHPRSSAPRPGAPPPSFGFRRQVPAFAVGAAVAAQPARSMFGAQVNGLFGIRLRGVAVLRLA